MIVMRLVSFGNLYLDYYIRNSEVVGVMGGKTNANILANLSDSFDSLFIGCCGNDDLGSIAIKSLTDLNINTIIKRIEKQTKSFFISESGYSKICPYCNRSVGYRGEYLTIDEILPNIKSDDYLVIDNLDSLSLEVLEKTENPAFIDLGYDKDIISKSLDELIQIFAMRFEIINMNERVYDLIKSKFMLDEVDIFNLFKPKILIITKGKKGCDIIIQDYEITKEIEDPAKEVDANGAGDSFFSVFIREYLKNQGSINEKFISSTYIKANIESRKCISGIGARSHILPNYQISSYSNCICENLKVD